MNRDLLAFDEDNARWRNQGKKVSWDERVEMIKEEFPAVRNPDWNLILRDHDVFGRLMRDILKVDQIEPGRAGPRPNLEYERGMQSYREVMALDYSERPFREAFRALTRRASVRSIANKTGLSRSHVMRLLNGSDLPTVEDLRVIATAYGKKPAFFAEYRSEYIMAAIAARLEDEYELTVAIYRKLVRA